MDSNNTPPQKKITVWMPLMLSIMMVMGMLIGLKLQPTPSAVAVVTEQEEIPSHSLGQGKVEELIRYIEAKYVDDVDRGEMVQEAIDNILKQLDPHSNYISAEQLKQVNEQLEGNFEGIGVEFLIVDDTIMVVKPLKEGPSEKAGILVGDRIVAIEDSLVAGVDFVANNTINLLRGEEGSKVKVGVRRNNEEELRHFTITRGRIPVNSVDVSYMLDNKTGYIKINRFSATTYQEFMEGLERMVEKEQMENVVIDLRQNPGGYLQEATKILNQIIQEKEKLLVYTKGRTVNKNEYKSSGRSVYDIKNTAILIDEGSASASEILAGAVQDWDRGVIIGRRSFGKGLVQEQYQLRDGSAIRLTVARYYTPSDRSIQKNYDDLDEYDKDLLTRYQHGELYEEDSIAIADTTQYLTASGRTVYGGGGITPDVFIPRDSLMISDTYIQLRQYIPAFVFRYMEKHKGDFSEMTLSNFEKNFPIKKKLNDEFLDFAQKQGAEFDAIEWRKIKPYIHTFLKARIAKNLFDDEGLFVILNGKDDAVQEAKQLMREDNPLSLK